MLILSVSLWARFSSSEPGLDSPNPTSQLDRRMHDCIRNVLDIVNEPRPQLWLYKDVWNVCAHEVYSLDSLVDFDIRREKLRKQEMDERIMLWMVVSVTMSGVVLAGLQLLASYRLASAGLGGSPEAGELSLETNKLAIKSSVTGLFILAFSLAFFVFYVKWIYGTQDVVIVGPDVKSIQTGVIEGYGKLDAAKPPDADPAPGKHPGPARDAAPPAEAGRSQQRITPPDRRH
jgi:hypothetical protein